MMKKIIIFLFCVIIVTVVLIFKKTTENPIPETLSQVEKSILKITTELDENLSKAAKQLSIVGINNNEAKKILSDLVRNNKYVVDVCTVSSEGIIQIIEPARFKKHQGVNIKNREQIVRLFKYKKPVVSKTFRAVEGFLAIDFECPIFANNGDFIGSISMLIRPKSFLDKIILPEIKGVPVDIWLMQDDGVIIYDQDVEEIGKNIFTDKIYFPFGELQNFARAVLKKEKGRGNYSFYFKDINEKVVKKIGYWTTLNILGTKWKLILTKSTNLKVSAKRTLKKLNLKSINKSFDELSKNPNFLNAIANNDTNKILYAFKTFYDSYSEIYSIQYIDTNIVNRFVYPAENSLINYKFDINKEHDKKFIDVLINKKEAEFELSLLEGGKGKFYFKPVIFKNKYYGQVYTILIK